MIKFYLIEKITKIYNLYLKKKSEKYMCVKNKSYEYFWFSGFQKQVDKKLMSAWHYITF